MASTWMYVAIFVPTYGAVVFATTIAASAFAALAILAATLPCTVSEISGAARTPAPVAAPTVAIETLPRSAPGCMPAMCAAASWAAAELVICETARGFWPKPCRTTPPGETGWPSEISDDAL